jgi:hypothetical protein
MYQRTTSVVVPKSNKIMAGFSPCVFVFRYVVIPQRLKPESKCSICSTTEAVP